MHVKVTSISFGRQPTVPQNPKRDVCCRSKSALQSVSTGSGIPIQKQKGSSDLAMSSPLRMYNIDFNNYMLRISFD